MKYISFKRAKDFEFSKLMLPSEFIVEVRDNIVPGWDSLPEADFIVEFEKNKGLLTAWVEAQEGLSAAIKASDDAVRIKEKRDQREFELWKLGRKKK